MTPVSMSAYLADAHRQDLLHEARQAALAAEAISATGGTWSAAILVVADLLVDAGQWLHALVSRKRLAHAHSAPCDMASKCHRDDALGERIAWLDV